MKKQFFCFVIFLAFLHSEAQNERKKAIQMLACTKESKVILRWASTHPSVWQSGNQAGYILEKYLLVKNGKVSKTPIKVALTTSLFKPKPLADWQNLVEVQKDKYAAIGAQSIYGKTFTVDAKNTNVFQLIDKAKETENRWSFALFSADQSVAVSGLMGLRFEDSDIKKGEKYLYRIYLASIPTGEKVDTGFVFVDADKVTVYTLPPKFAIEIKDKMAKLSWDNRLHQQFYSSYFIERSEDAKTWETRNAEPYLNTSADGEPVKTMVYFDTIPAYDKVYYYRFRGRTYFGELSGPSTVVSGMCKAALPITPNIISVAPFEKMGLKIDWEFKAEYNKDIVKFKLYAASKPKGPFKPLQTALPTERSLILKDPKSVNYFVMSALGRDSIEYKSTPILYQLDDAEAPAIPIFISSNIDSNGISRLIWKKNKEEDLLGYRVFKANGLNESFINVSSKIKADTVFSDSVNIKTLTKNVYYKITSLDNHFNSSDFSQIIRLARPDKIPPSSPVWKSYNATDSVIVLQWINSSSTDVIAHVLYRSLAGTNEWKILAKYDTVQSKINTEMTFKDRDKTLEKGVFYEYTVIAIDDSKNESPLTQTLKVQKIDNGLRPTIENVASKIDKENKLVTLNWIYPFKDVEKILVYRKSQLEPLTIIKGVYVPDHVFSDKNISLNNTYTYQLRAIYKNGTSSPFSKEIILKF